MDCGGRYPGIRHAIDGIYCETDEASDAIDGMLKAIDRFPEPIDRIRTPIDRFQRDAREAPEAIDGIPNAIPWLFEPDRWHFM